MTWRRFMISLPPAIGRPVSARAAQIETGPAIVSFDRDREKRSPPTQCLSLNERFSGGAGMFATTSDSRRIAVSRLCRHIRSFYLSTREEIEMRLCYPKVTMTTHRIGLNSGRKRRQSIELGQNKFVYAKFIRAMRRRLWAKKRRFRIALVMSGFASGGATKSAFGCYAQRVWLKPSFSVSTECPSGGNHIFRD